jgi:hypothetical protein
MQLLVEESPMSGGFRDVSKIPMLCRCWLMRSRRKSRICASFSKSRTVDDRTINRPSCLLDLRWLQNGDTGVDRLPEGEGIGPLTANNHLREVRFVAFVFDGFPRRQA